jgi:hypothetical protein
MQSHRDNSVTAPREALKPNADADLDGAFHRSI